jgi:CHASE1-domain containing sensor protein
MTNDAEERLDRQITEIQNGVERRMQAYEQVLFGGKGLFASSQEVTRNEWKTFVEIQSINERFPGIQGVGFSKLIGDKTNLEAHIEQIRKEGFSDYIVKPEGERKEYHPVVYLEPMNERNKRAIGYDMYSESTRQHAIDLARDTGVSTISGKVKLVQETEIGIQAGFYVCSNI